jgi:amino acid permease
MPRKLLMTMLISQVIAYFSSIGIMVYFIVTSLGEMSAYLPVPGAFTTFGARFVDPAIGFMLGWNYCLLGQSLSGRLNM